MRENSGAVKRLVYIAVMTAVMEAAKIALNPIPNVELVTLLVIVFTKQFGWKMTLPSVLIFAFIECTYWGFGTWSIVYFYMWPLLVFLTEMTGRQNSVWAYVLLSGAFGLFFGAFCSVATLVIGGLNAAFAWWIAGIPYDLIHGVSNLIIAALLFVPLNRALEILNAKNRMISKDS